MSSAGVTALHINDISDYYGKPYPFCFYPEEFKCNMLLSMRKTVDTCSVVAREGSVVDIDGEELWFHSTLVPTFSENKQLDYIIIVSIDITKRKRAEEELCQLNYELEQRVKFRTRELAEANKQLTLLSETDSLTMMANRRMYTKRLTAEVSRMHRTGQFLSLLVIDIDNFKKFNDKYGHDFGDVVLKAVANLIQASLLRDIDFSARIGGEEFAVLLSSTDEEGALYIAEKIRATIQAEKIAYATSYVTLTVSIGVSVQHSNKMSVDNVFHRADTALYAAKSSGRNKVVLYQSSLDSETSV